MSKLTVGKHYHLNGSFFHNDDIVDFVQDVVLHEIDEDKSLWAMDEDGDIFEVLAEDLSEIKER